MTETTKTCGMCFMQIPAQAKKCPHCQHFQNRMSRVIFHPAFAVITMVFMLMIGFQQIFDTGKDYQMYAGQVKITESKMAFGEEKGGNIVAVMGTIMNNSPIPWKDIRFQVEFQDATGRRSDTGQKEDYCYYLPANSSLSFKTSLRRQFPETNYISHTISVVSARDGRARW